MDNYHQQSLLIQSWHAIEQAKLQIRLARSTLLFAGVPNSSQLILNLYAIHHALDSESALFSDPSFNPFDPPPQPPTPPTSDPSLPTQ